MIYLHYKDTKTFGHSFSFPLIFKTLRTSYLQVGNFSYVIINTSNLTKKGQDNFAKRKSNYTIRGGYDFNSVMGYSSMTSSTSMVNDTSKPMYTKKDGSLIYQGRDLSDNDRSWLNYYYLPYVARSDTYAELDTIVYNGNNERLTEEQRLQLQAQLNNGNPTPPSGGRIKNDF